MLKIINVVGARPNFMKIAPIQRAFEKIPEVESLIVHTGQHYDARMSDIFFRQLELPQPHHYLGVEGGSHAVQTGRVMEKFEQILLDEKPDMVIVVGDVNSTLACSITAKKLHIPVAHVEAGLRSGDMRMPEEVNRIVTDSISDLLFVTEQSGLDHLEAEGVPTEKVVFAGNVMIDSLIHFQASAEKEHILSELDLKKGEYTLVTMHRPSNVDHEEGIALILKILQDISPVVFPIHPRTQNNFEKFGLMDELRRTEGVILLEPQGYLPFLKLLSNAGALLTDSGGIQEETTYLGVPCLTFRENTERPSTITLGTNEMVPLEHAPVVEKVEAIYSGQFKKGNIPPLWDGQAAERITAFIVDYLKR
jgi:UDP-N-acetylglucosamine 2-epimerase (non-hydrolysing)